VATLCFTNNFILVHASTNFKNLLALSMTIINNASKKYKTCLHFMIASIIIELTLMLE
jgi:hypothetical protein